MEPKPKKVWLIIGHRAADNSRRVSYPTDPRLYDLPDFKLMSDEEYDEVSDRMRAFTTAKDAIDFCYDCGLEMTMIHGFKLVDGKYFQDKVVQDEVAEYDW